MASYSLHERDTTDLNPQGLDVVGPVGAAREVGQVELNLVPAVVQAHRHRADERLDARRALVVTRAEAAPHVLVVQHLQQRSSAHVIILVMECIL